MKLRQMHKNQNLTKGLLYGYIDGLSFPFEDMR